MSDHKRNRLRTVVLSSEDGLMVKEIIYGRLDLGRGLLRRMKKGGGVFLNGKRDFITRRVKAGDLIDIEFFDESTNLVPVDLPLDIVYEDEFLLAVNKPAGMVVHPTGSYREGTLANAIAFYLQKNKLSTKVRLLQRIDKDTSGLVLVAKEPYTLQRLQAQRASQMRPEYLAIIKGWPNPSTGVISLPIGRPSLASIKRAVDTNGKKARTKYKVIRKLGKYSLVHVVLETGRTHQIRVHMQAIGHPLVGDPLYGESLELLSRQALHAWRLTFTHPRTGQAMNLSCPIPRDLFSFIKQENLMDV